MNEFVKRLEIEMIRENAQTAKGLRFLFENYNPNNAGISTIKVYGYSGITEVAELSKSTAEVKLIEFICKALYGDILEFECEYNLDYDRIIFEVMDSLTNAYKNAKASKTDKGMIEKILKYKELVIGGEI